MEILKHHDLVQHIADELPTNYLSVFDHFGELAFKGLRNQLDPERNNRSRMFQLNKRFVVTSIIIRKL